MKADVNEDTINEYFDHFEETLREVPPGNIVNYDETNLTDDPGREKVYVARGNKHARRILDTSKSSTSLMFAGSADGVMLPVYVVYQAKHIYPEWILGGPQQNITEHPVAGLTRMCLKIG